MKKGKFIVFEGLDGTGKSTQLRLLAEKLKQMGNRVYETFEPTDSPIGSVIHQMMTGRLKADERTIAALFAADRIDHLTNHVDGILDKINQGIDVVCDRYYFSSYAYHGVHLSMDWVIGANSICAEALRPDINIFLDLEPSVCLERIKKNRFHLELYEKEQNMINVRAKYLEAFEKLKKDETVMVVDAAQTPEQLFTDIWNRVEHLFTAS